MGILEQAKGLLHKGKDLTAEHAEQVKAGIDKVEGLANKATGGKFTDKIEAAGDKLEGMLPIKAEEVPAEEVPAEPAGVDVPAEPAGVEAPAEPEQGTAPA